jgi:hypothetical protein
VRQALGPQRASARASIIRSAVLFTLLFLLVLAAFIYALRGFVAAPGSGIVGLVIVGFVTLLIGYQSAQSLRDLAARPAETRGAVRRKWRAADFLFFFRGHYLMVEKDVFRVKASDFLEIGEGDIVSVVHYPHTGAVVSLEVLKKGGGGGVPVLDQP